MTGYSRRQRSTPFLQRNVLQGMGNTQSSAQKATVAGHPQGDPDDHRAAKRRRLDTTKPAPPHVLADQLFHAREVGQVQRNLCVQVHRIIHKDSKRVNTAVCEDVEMLRARCKLMLSHWANNREVMLHCTSQMCNIKSFKDPGSPLRMARVLLPRPFYIPEDCMRVNRDDGNSFDLADVYRLCIELEAAGPTHQLPIVLGSSDPEMGRSRKPELQHWVFQASMSDLFTKKRTSPLLSLKVVKGCSSLASTDHLIEVDTKYAAAFEATAIRPLEEGVKPSITVLPEGSSDDLSQDLQHFDSPPGTPISRSRRSRATPMKDSKNSSFNVDAQEDDEAEEELTPRSLRVRPSQTYNLKVLSDKAQGKERKQRKRRNTNAVVEEGSVTYLLPREQVNLDSFRCITCGMAHTSLPLLQAHLANQHAEYEYIPHSTGRGAEFQVSHRYELYSFGPEPFSLRRPTKVFDLDQFAEGNISQLDARLLPEERTTPAVTTRGRSRRQASKPPPQARSKLLIPDIKQPLYDPISKATLQPGTEYKKPAPNDQWLIQWHQDALADFTDVPPDEMEYMQEWDRFMLTKRISSDCYLPRAWLCFVKLKTDWLLSSQARMIEFGKHFTYLLARSSLDHDTVEQALEHIGACKAKLGATKKDSNAPSAQKEHAQQGPPVRKSAGGCQVCGLTVLGPRMLLCSNPQCAKRLYHSDCISENAKKSVEDPDWICNQCVDGAAAERTGRT